VPATDGRRLFLGWMSNWQYANVVPTASWRSATTIARELSLKKTAAGLRLISQPVKELDTIRGESVPIPGRTVRGEVDITKEVSLAAPTAELLLAFDATEKSKDFGIELSNAQGQKTLIGYETAQKRFYVDRTQSGNNDFSKDFGGRHYAPRQSKNQSLSMHLVIDVASVELFADDGEVVMTEIFFPETPYTQVKLFAKEGEVKVASGRFTPLKSVLKANPSVAVN
jgi:sucrose-6-phosphate hydrolase SacC (GH32 family)